MTPNTTLMRQEIEEIPVAVERLLTKGTDALAAAVAVAGRLATLVSVIPLVWSVDDDGVLPLICGEVSRSIVLCRTNVELLFH